MIYNGRTRGDSRFVYMYLYVGYITYYKVKGIKISHKHKSNINMFLNVEIYLLENGTINK